MFHGIIYVDICARTHYIIGQSVIYNAIRPEHGIITKNAIAADGGRTAYEREHGSH